MALDLRGIFETPAKDASLPWGGYDFSKPSLVAIAANADGDGAVLWGVGGHIRMEMEEAGLTHLDDLGLHPPQAGVWIWEGRYVWSPGSYEYPMDGSSEPVGTWRLPTDEEWAAIREGRCPWDDREWKLCLCTEGGPGAYEGPCKDCPRHGEGDPASEQTEPLKDITGCDV